MGCRIDGLPHRWAMRIDVDGLPTDRSIDRWRARREAPPPTTTARRRRWLAGVVTVVVVTAVVRGDGCAQCAAREVYIYIYVYV